MHGILPPTEGNTPSVGNKISSISRTNCRYYLRNCSCRRFRGSVLLIKLSPVVWRFLIIVYRVLYHVVMLYCSIKNVPSSDAFLSVWIFHVPETVWMRNIHLNMNEITSIFGIFIVFFPHIAQIHTIKSVQAVSITWKLQTPSCTSRLKRFWLHCRIYVIFKMQPFLGN